MTSEEKRYPYLVYGNSAALGERFYYLEGVLEAGPLTNAQVDLMRSGIAALPEELPLIDEWLRSGIHLTKQEIALLRPLVMRLGHVVYTRVLAKAVTRVPYEEQDRSEDQAVRVYISRVRKKLVGLADVECHASLGYRLTVKGMASATDDNAETTEDAEPSEVTTTNPPLQIA